MSKLAYSLSCMRMVSCTSNALLADIMSNIQCTYVTNLGILAVHISYANRKILALYQKSEGSNSMLGLLPYTQER